MPEHAATAHILISRAASADLPAIIGVYAEDLAGGHGDHWSEDTAPRYREVFARLAANPDYELYVARHDGQIIGTFLLHVIETLVGGGGRSCALHSVSVAAAARGKGAGAAILRFCQDRARALGATKLTLVSGNQRTDAHRFYRREGFSETHRAFARKL